MKSLQKKLTTTLSLLILLILGGLWWAVVSLVHYETDRYLFKRLADDLDALPKHLIEKNGTWHLTINHLDPSYLSTKSRRYFVIKLPSQTLTSPSLNNFPLYTPAITSSPMVYETKGPHSKKLLIRAETGWLTDAQGEKIPVKYYVAENHDPIYQNQFRFDAMFAVAILLTLLALFFLQKFLIKRTFSTLHPITEKLKTLESHRTVDLDSKEAPLEVQPLLVALQNALTRLQKQLENFRKQNANLAHSLKTPINILYQQADLLPDNAQRQQIQQQLNTLTRLVERELKKARISEGIQQAQCFHLKKDLTPLITSIQTLYQEKNLKIEKHCQNSQSCLPIEQEDGYELLGNLLDNAAKWCQHKVEITSEAQQLIIEDDGPGVPPEQLANIRQRGQRLDETTPGHGIGLSIVEDISDAYEIKITFSRSKKLGGLSVQLLFS